MQTGRGRWLAKMAKARARTSGRFRASSKVWLKTVTWSAMSDWQRSSCMRPPAMPISWRWFMVVKISIGAEFE